MRSVDLTCRLRKFAQAEFAVKIPSRPLRRMAFAYSANDSGIGIRFAKAESLPFHALLIRFQTRVKPPNPRRLYSKKETPESVSFYIFGFI